MIYEPDPTKNQSLWVWSSNKLRDYENMRLSDARGSICVNFLHHNYLAQWIHLICIVLNIYWLSSFILQLSKGQKAEAKHTIVYKTIWIKREPKLLLVCVYVCTLIKRTLWNGFKNENIIKVFVYLPADMWRWRKHSEKMVTNGKCFENWFPCNCQWAKETLNSHTYSHTHIVCVPFCCSHVWMQLISESKLFLEFQLQHTLAHIKLSHTK